jgi:hypothetical protein
MAATAIVASASAAAPARTAPSWSAHQRSSSTAKPSISDVDAQGSSVAPAKSGHTGQKIDRLA